MLYRRGKEYLFIPAERQHKITERPSVRATFLFFLCDAFLAPKFAAGFFSCSVARFGDMWEFETYLEWIFEQLGYLVLSWFNNVQYDCCAVCMPPIPHQGSVPMGVQADN